jgi:tripartite-type tricarboxylate transporter receptor subunit TctC
MKKLPRRAFLHIAAGIAGAPLFTRVAWTQPYPSRPVRILVGFPAGGPTDIIARLISQYLAERMGQSFIVENRPGAGGNIATEAVVRGPSDGHTLLLVTVANAINATLYDNLSFNPIKDIEPISGIIRYPNVMEVHPSLPVGTVSEFIAYAKANPGKINIATAGNGTSQDVSCELFKMMAGIDVVIVKYRGSAPALADVIAGHVQGIFDGLQSSVGHIKSGKLRALAVTTNTRSEALPEVPSMSEFLPGYEASGWNGLGAPLHMPAEVIDKLNAETNAALTDPKFRSRLTELGGAPLPGSPAEFGRLFREETEKWAKVIRAAGIKVE